MTLLRALLPGCLFLLGNPCLRRTVHHREGSRRKCLGGRGYDTHHVYGRRTTSTNYSSSIGYDGLNRPRAKAYTDGTPPNYTDRTPSVTYTYDQDLSGGVSNYAKGRLVSVASGGTTVQYKRFDAVGRVLQHTQTTQVSGAAHSPTPTIPVA